MNTEQHNGMAPVTKTFKA